MAKPQSIPSQIGGYAVLPLSLAPLPSYPVKAVHYLYVSAHQPKIPSPTASRSIFLVNIPFDSTETHLKTLFSTQLGLPAGRIEDIEFEGARRKALTSESLQIPKPPGNRKKRKRESEGRLQKQLDTSSLPSTWDRDLQMNGLTAVVIFVDRPSMEATLKAVKSAIEQPTHPAWGQGCEGKVAPLGYERYQKHHQLTYPDKAQLLKSVDDYMTAFAAKEAEQARLRERLRQEPDQEGFITVTRGGRTNPATQEAAQALAEKHQSRQQGLEDFYRFQGRERKKAKARELVMKFEEDRNKIRMLKEKRSNFRPE